MSQNILCHCFSDHRHSPKKPSQVSGLLLSLIIAVASAIAGSRLPAAGGPVIAILAGMAVTLLFRNKSALQPGLHFTSRKFLPFAIIFLGFGLNLNTIREVRKQQELILILPAAALFAALYLTLHLRKRIDRKILLPVILASVGASVIATAAVTLGASSGIFLPFQALGKFLLIAAMAAVGLNTDIIKLIHTDRKYFLLRLSGQVEIIFFILLLQRVPGIW